MIRRIIHLVGRISIKKILSDPFVEMSRIFSAVARRLDAHARFRKDKQLPAWVHQEIAALAGIEPDLLGLLGQEEAFSHSPVPVITQWGLSYRAIVNAVGGGCISHVLVVPWLVRGGADRGALYHLQAWVEAFPAAHALVIVTEDVPSPWLERVPTGIRVLEFGRMTVDLELYAKVELFTRLLVQMQPKVIHNINSRVAWEAYRKYGLVLRQASLLYASVFCDDHNAEGQPIGYARSFLRPCAVNLKKVFCDNRIYPEKWSREMGIPIGLFTVLRFPYPLQVRHRKSPVPLPVTPRVLWAGRFHPQKRLDLLVEIARSMPEVIFDVHGSDATGSAEAAIRDLKGLVNVNLYGAFEDFAEIARDDHVAYLFTSSWEGVPTILLDACAAGLPIVAPLVGGIEDLLQSSVLVSDPDDVNSFVAQLKDLIDNPVICENRRKQQYEALEVGRSWGEFIETLRCEDSFLSRYSSVTDFRENQGRIS